MTNIRDKLIYLSKVNTPPVGLQNLLGNVNQGVNPHELDHKITPVVDLYPHWAVNKLKTELSFGEVAGTSGEGLTINVPDGELWQVVAASAHYENVSAGNDDTNIGIGIADSSDAVTTIVSVNSFGVNSPGAVGQFGSVAGCAFPDRFILSSGWGIRGEVISSSQAGVRTMYVKVVYVKLTE